MDFKEGETDKNEVDSNTLKQNNEPIISFSPQRGRFDSGKTSFSVDFQEEDPLQENINSENNPVLLCSPNSIKTPACAVPATNSLAQIAHHGLINDKKPNFHETLPSSSTTAFTPAIKTQANSSKYTTDKINKASAGFGGEPISLMVNGAALSTSTLDLHKRLEKRIAQATAAAAASKTNDLADILSIDSLESESVLKKSENQITFSPQKTKGDPTSFQLPSSLWDSGSSTSDIELWESKLTSKQKEASENSLFMDDGQTNLQSEIKTEDDEGFIVKLGSTCNNDPSIINTCSRVENAHLMEKSSNNNETFNKLCNNNIAKSSLSEQQQQSKNKSGLNSRNNAMMTTVSPTSTVVVVNSGFDIRKVSALLPPQRLAIPCKNSNPTLSSSSSQFQSSHSTASNSSNAEPTSSAASSASNNAGGDNTENTFSRSNNQIGGNSTSANRTRKSSVSETSCSGNGNVISTGNGNVKAGSNTSKLSSEKKPLVQWDSDESEEELSFFPPAKRGVITDNLSIDNMSLSGEEDDLHLTPPRPLGKKCPCDPRTWIERRRELSSSHHHHHPGDSIRISSKQCVIS